MREELGSVSTHEKGKKIGRSGEKQIYGGRKKTDF